MDEALEIRGWESECACGVLFVCGRCGEAVDILAIDGEAGVFACDGDAVIFGVDCQLVVGIFCGNDLAEFVCGEQYRPGFGNIRTVGMHCERDIRVGSLERERARGACLGDEFDTCQLILGASGGRDARDKIYCIEQGCAVANDFHNGIGSGCEVTGVLLVTSVQQETPEKSMDPRVSVLVVGVVWPDNQRSVESSRTVHSRTLTPWRTFEWLVGWKVGFTSG